MVLYLANSDPDNYHIYGFNLQIYTQVHPCMYIYPWLSPLITMVIVMPAMPPCKAIKKLTKLNFPRKQKLRIKALLFYQPSDITKISESIRSYPKYIPPPQGYNKYFQWA